MGSSIVKTAKAVVSKKQKAAAFVNWSILDDNGEVLLKSNRGFSLTDNEYLTLEERALIELATNNGGQAVVNAQLRIIIAKAKPDKLDISKIQLVG